MNTRQVQLLLAYLGYDPAMVDGVLGPKTKAAAYDFQQEFAGLTVDGMPGEETQKALRHAVAYGMQKKEEQPTSGTPPDKQVTGTYWDGIKYFRREEFRCPCPRCGGFPVEPNEKLVRIAERVRAHFGVPIIISSGVRCQAHNDELRGSVPNSRHVLGKAMDFCVRDFSSAAVLDYLQSLVKQGVLRYAYVINESYVHMDVA